jgi:predicted dehydrogenase
VDEIVWGILGCGLVTEAKSGPAFDRVEGSRLAAVMRRDAAKAEDYARRHGVPRWHDSVDALLADAEVNAVYVATPTNTHRALAIRALESGRPVLVEKPIALDGREADAMLDAAARTGQRLFVAYYRRTLPRFEVLRELVQSGALGEVRCVVAEHLRPTWLLPDVAWKADPAVNGGGLFVDAQTHTLDWLDHCFGPPDAVTGEVRRFGEGPAEDFVAYHLSWRAGPIARGLFCFGAARAVDRVEVVGTRATASMPFFRDGPIEVLDGAGGLETRLHPDPPHVHEPLIARVVEDLRGGRPAPSDGVSGARTTRLIDTLYADFRGR